MLVPRQLSCGGITRKNIPLKKKIIILVVFFGLYVCGSKFLERHFFRGCYTAPLEQCYTCPNDDIGLLARCSGSRKDLQVCVNILHAPLSPCMLFFFLPPSFLCFSVFSDETAALPGWRSSDRRPGKAAVLHAFSIILFLT